MLIISLVKLLKRKKLSGRQIIRLANITVKLIPSLGIAENIFLKNNKKLLTNSKACGILKPSNEGGQANGRLSGMVLQPRGQH